MTMRPDPAVAVLIGCQAVVTTGLMVLVPIMPLFIRDLAGMDGSAAQAVRWSSIALAAPGCGALLCAPFGLKGCERFGYRRTLLLSLAVFVVSMTMMALADRIGVFVAGRVLQGASTVSVIITAFIARVADPARQGRALGLQESAVAAGALAGPVLGGVLQDVWSVRPLLLGVAACTAAAGFMLAAHLREPGARAAVALPVASAGVLPGTSAVSARDGVHRAWSVRRACLRWLVAGSLTQAGAFALVNVFALFIDARFAGTPALASKIGLLHTVGWLATLVAGPLWGARNDRYDPTRHFIGAALVCAGAITLLPFVADLWLIGLLRIVQGASYAALAQSALVMCCRSVPPSMRDQVIVIARSAMVLGQLLGPLAVLLFLPLSGYAGTLWLTGAMFAAAAAVVRGAAVTHFSPSSDSR